MYCWCSFVVPIACLPPFVRFVGVTITPLGREGSLTALCSIFVLEQQPPFRIYALHRQWFRDRCRL